jgi:hypothetical protein
MIGGSVSKVGIQTTKDVTPLTLNSFAALSDTASNVYTNAYFRISGLSQNIKIKVSYDDSNGDEVYYLQVTSIGDVASVSSIPANQLNQITNNELINFINGNYLIVGIFNNVTSESKQIDILNNSSGDAAITTIDGNVIT